MDSPAPYDPTRGPCLSDEEPSMVTFLAGPDKVRFVAHENLLRHYSPLLCQHLRSNSFAGSLHNGKHSMVLRYKEDDWEMIRFFVHFLYHQRLPTDDVDQPSLLERWYCTQDGDTSAKIYQLISLYGFADTFDVHQLKKLIIVDIVAMYTVDEDDYADPDEVDDDDTPEVPEEALEFAFEVLAPDSRLLELLVAVACKYTAISVLERRGDAYCHYGSARHVLDYYYKRDSYPEPIELHRFVEDVDHTDMAVDWDDVYGGRREE
ncbi:hypothetical protein IQ07DRAFT_682566 [Pyrenochaeta sp. DS3sAY3a]|nr:hypothetical protein IQ07DRAFT_682566 [Pyrenochaeta sp. DS3sAY3a]